MTSVFINSLSLKSSNGDALWFSSEKFFDEVLHSVLTKLWQFEYLYGPPSDNTPKAKRRRRSKQNKTYNILHCSTHLHIARLAAMNRMVRILAITCSATRKSARNFRLSRHSEVRSAPQIILSGSGGSFQAPFRRSCGHNLIPFRETYERILTILQWKLDTTSWTSPAYAIRLNIRVGALPVRKSTLRRRFKACFVATLGTHWCCCGQTWKKCSSNCCCLPLLETLEPDRRPDNPRSVGGGVGVTFLARNDV